MKQIQILKILGLIKVDVKSRTIKVLRKHLFLITIITVAVLSAIIRWYCVPFVSEDMRKYLIPWFSELKAGGGFFALGKSIGNYNLAYLTLLALGTYLPLPAILVIKVFSMLFDYAAAGACVYLLYVLSKPRTHLLYGAGFILALLSPETILNSAIWGQCDSIYTTFLLLSLSFLIQHRMFSAFSLFGWALAFKLQGIFFLPLFIIVWLTDDRCKLKHFFLIPAMMVLSGLPAIFMGHPLRDVFGIYGIQIGWMRVMTAGCPNLYSFAPNIEFEYFAPVGILVTLILLGLAAALFIYKNRVLTDNEIQLLSIWSCMVCVYFLPDMHERYLFPADLLLIVWAIYTSRYSDHLCALMAVGVSTLSYLPYLFQARMIPMWVLSLVRLSCLIYITDRLIGSRRFEFFKSCTLYHQH